MSKHKHEPLTVKPTETAPAAAAPPPSADEAAELPVPAPPAPLTAEEIEDLKSKAAQARQWHDQWLRSAAEFDNYKKRAARERQEAVRFANEALLQKLMPVLDSFDMAAAAVASGQNASLPALQTGVAMILQQFRSILAEAGMEEIDASGQPFDPNFHEAVSQEESAEVAEGHVLRQLRKGYRLRDRLLRPAAVVVAKPAPQPETPAAPEA